MSRSTSFNFKVAGDNYEEIVSKADNIISRFMSSAEEDEFEDETTTPLARINYEVVVSMSGDISSEYEYEAEVFAKIRD